MGRFAIKKDEPPCVSLPRRLNFPLNGFFKGVKGSTCPFQGNKAGGAKPRCFRRAGRANAPAAIWATRRRKPHAGRKADMAKRRIVPHNDFSSFQRQKYVQNRRKKCGGFARKRDAKTQKTRQKAHGFTASEKKREKMWKTCLFDKKFCRKSCTFL